MIYSFQALRALAVLLVIVYHFSYINYIPWAANMFVGVDIFFVLSGYFMAPYIFQVKQLPPFLFLKKRFIRLYPSLILAIVFSLSSSILFLNRTTYDFSLNLKLILSSIFGFSNIILSRSLTGYFDPGSIRLIFLHSWSLSIELQFFFLVFVLLFLLKYINLSNKRLLLVLTIFALLSISRPFTYFDFQSRFWEFYLGLLSFYIVSILHFSINHRFISQVFSIISFLFLAVIPTLLSNIPNNLIIYISCIMTFVFLTLSPVTSCDYFNPSLYSNKFVQYPFKLLALLGLLSYELYLFHWPILATFYWLHLDLPLFLELSIIFFVSWLCYTLSYRTSLFKWSIGSLSFLSAAVLLHLLSVKQSPLYTSFHNLDYRNKDVVNVKRCNYFIHSLHGLAKSSDCFNLDKYSQLIIGDSSSVPLALYLSSDLDTVVLYSFRSSCLIGVPTSQACRLYDAHLLELASSISTRKVKPTLFITQRYEGYLTNADIIYSKSHGNNIPSISVNSNFDDQLNQHKSFIEKFISISGIKSITLLTYGPTFPNVNWQCTLPYSTSSCKYPLSKFSSSYYKWIDKFNSLFPSSSYTTINLLPRVCPTDTCYFNTIDYSYSDYGHISTDKQSLQFFFNELSKP